MIGNGQNMVFLVLSRPHQGIRDTKHQCVGPNLTQGLGGCPMTTKVESNPGTPTSHNESLHFRRNYARLEFDIDCSVSGLISCLVRAGGLGYRTSARANVQKTGFLRGLSGRTMALFPDKELRFPAKKGCKGRCSRELNTHATVHLVQRRPKGGALLALDHRKRHSGFGRKSTRCTLSSPLRI